METNPGPLHPVPEICSNVRGLAGNHSDLTVASSQHDILLCSETLVSDMRNVSEILVPGFGNRIPAHLAQGQDASGPRDGRIRPRWLRSISPTQI